VTKTCKLALACGTAAAALLGLMSAQPAFAQATTGNTDTAPTAEAAKAASVDELVVVGSRIRRDTFNSPSPVEVITREEATMAGFASISDSLQSVGVTGGAGQINNAFGGFVTDGGPGANTLSLRGLGAGRTLVLINGRRVAPAGTRGAVGSADLNVLPDAIIDRVEILRDGASSIYGSDAIAGVVNVVTMNDLHGLTLEGQYNRPSSAGGEEVRFSAVGGLSGDRWKFSGSAEYYERSDLTLGQRDWTRCNTDNYRDPATGASLDYIDPMTGKPKCYPITTTGSDGVTINTIGTSSVTAANAAGLGLIGPVVGAPGSVGTTFNRFRPNSGITTGLVGFEGVGGGSNNLNVRDTFDPRVYNDSLISPVKVYTGYLQGSYQLQALGDGEAYFEFLANERDSQQTGFRQLSLDYRKGSPLIPSSLAFSTFGPDQGTSGGQNVGVRAFIGFGNDHSTQKVDFFKETVGLRGKLNFLDGWRYDLTLTQSNSDADYGQQSFLTNRVTFASDVVAAPAGFDSGLVRNGLTCRVNLTNPAERCIPYPQLNSATIGGNLPQDFKNYIFQNVVGNTKYEETMVSAVIDGPLFTLPAGKVQGVLGFEYRHQHIDDQPDPNSVANNLYNLTSSAPTVGSDAVKEVYAEVEVPLLRDLPLVNDLTFNGSYRYTDYDSYGGDSTYKAGLVYSPVKWLSLRATKGTSFRAPALFEQYQGATSGFLSSAGDPCNNYGVASAQRKANCALELPGNPNFQATSGITVLSQGGASAGLHAETSDNTTVGIIVQPPIGSLGSLAIAVDYFDIKIENGVDQPGASNILQLCYDDPQFRSGGGFCRLVTRNAATNALTVSNAYTNIATQIAKGIDYDLRYERDLGPGRFRFNAQLTQYTSQASKLFADDALDEYNGTINTPKWSGTFDATYTWEKWKFRYGVEWIQGTDSYAFLEEDPATSKYIFKVPDYYLHQLSVRYTGEGWQATAGVRNLFDKDPPSISSGFYNRVGNAPLYSGYDYVGRTTYVNIVKSF
jgi:iron complex outermembrane recepter protein